MNNNNRDDRQFYTAYHLFKPLLKESDQDLPSEILPRIEGVEHGSDSRDLRSSRRIFGNPNIFRIFRFSITFAERLFQKLAVNCNIAHESNRLSDRFRGLRTYNNGGII